MKVYSVSESKGKGIKLKFSSKEYRKILGLFFLASLFIDLSITIICQLKLIFAVKSYLFNKQTQIFTF